MAFLDKYLQPGKKPTLPKPFKPAAPTNLQSPAVPQMSTGATQINLSGLAGRILPGLNTQPKTTGFNPVADTQNRLGISPNTPNQSSVSLDSLQAANNARRAALAPLKAPTVQTTPTVPTVSSDQSAANALGLEQLKREAEQIRTTGSAVTPAAPTGQSEQDRLLQQMSDSNPEFADQIMDKLGYTGSPNLITSSDVQGKNQPAVSENRQRLEALREAYSKTLEAPQTSETEKSLEAISKQMANLSASEQLGLNKIKDQPIALGLLTGQEAALQRGVLGQMGALEAQAVPLRTRLEQEQARRLAAQKQKEVELGFAQKDVEAEKPIEVGGRLVDPRTGEVVFEPPAENAGLQELSPGATLYNPKTGKAVYTAPRAESASQDSSRVLSATEAQALGVPFGTTAGQAYGLSVTGKPTAEQSKARQFAVAAENADKILADVNYDPGLIELSLVPNVLKSEKRQQFEQASRAFVNATLRRESGATITDSEFQNKYRELIPQAGDTPAVKAQKAAARAAAVLSIQEAGGDVQSTSAPTTSDFSW